MWESFIEEVNRQIREMVDSEGAAIKSAAAVVAGAIEMDGIIHTFGSGHSALIAQEIFCRAGGIVPINAILDPSFLLSDGAMRSTNMERLPGAASISLAGHQIRSGDAAIIISNSGKNQAPVEMALKLKELGVKIIAITSMKHTQSVKPSHPSGKRLFEVADVTVDNHANTGDASISVPGVKALVGPTSTIMGSLIVQSIIIDAVALLAKKGKAPAIFVSVNMEVSNLEELSREYMKYRGRIRHF
ncbi:MAG: SIS domain-containing protein [Deltaproteobacteria bacterium]|nr:SIS domain-containing protein [Candidatus Zymogenaceae bacterium]